MFDWYGVEFGFWVSEYIVDEQEQYWVVWIQCWGGVYDFVFINGVGLCLYYWVYWMFDVMSIIKICDILVGVWMFECIECGLGCYGVFNVFFLYICDLDGYCIELYIFDYIMVDFDFELICWLCDDLRWQMLWGVKMLCLWFEDVSLLEVFGGGVQFVYEGVLIGILVYVI